MSIYRHYEEYLNKEIFAETPLIAEVKSKAELIECQTIDQDCVREVFQTGMKASSVVNRGNKTSFIYYFPIFCKLKVEAILLLFPKKNFEKDFSNGLGLLERLAELGCNWIGNSMEYEQIKREHQLSKIEIKKLFVTITEPLCMVSGKGIIQEINDPMASIVKKNRSSLIGESVSEVISYDYWNDIKNQKRRGETVLKINHQNEDFSAVIQPILIDQKVESFILHIKTKKEAKKERTPRRLYTFEDIKGISKELLMAINAAKRVAKGDATIMLRGESGTGKEMFAQSIHQKSNRRDQPFVAINCAAIPENLLESELFGYEKGAFTGAVKGKQGRFELANKGTLFLDEIGDMPLYLQAKILRVIQEKTIERIGSNQSIRIDVRLITATHQNLENLVREGKFREDLYYRLSVIPINIPPLRQRKEDLPILIEHYMKEFCSNMNRLPKRLSKEVLHRMLEYHWPGNIRELQNVVRHFVELEMGETVTLESMPASLSNQENNSFSVKNTKNQRGSFKQDKNEILFLLDRFGWNTEGKKKVASELGISLATLYRQLKKLKLS
ncbi:sigma-54 interaction domain-containing protein [Bacillota bacterium Lsc_1132]